MKMDCKLALALLCCLQLLASISAANLTHVVVLDTNVTVVNASAAALQRLSDEQQQQQQQPQPAKHHTPAGVGVAAAGGQAYYHGSYRAQMRHTARQARLEARHEARQVLRDQRAEEAQESREARAAKAAREAEEEQDDQDQGSSGPLALVKKIPGISGLSTLLDKDKLRSLFQRTTALASKAAAAAASLADLNTPAQSSPGVSIASVGAADAGAGAADTSSSSSSSSSSSAKATSSSSSPSMPRMPTVSVIKNLWGKAAKAEKRENNKGSKDKSPKEEKDELAGFDDSMPYWDQEEVQEEEYSKPASGHAGKADEAKGKHSRHHGGGRHKRHSAQGGSYKHAPQQPYGQAEPEQPPSYPEGGSSSPKPEQEEHPGGSGHDSSKPHDGAYKHAPSRGDGGKGESGGSGGNRGAYSKMGDGHDDAPKGGNGGAYSKNTGVGNQDGEHKHATDGDGHGEQQPGGGAGGAYRGDSDGDGDEDMHGSRHDKRGRHGHAGRHADRRPRDPVYTYKHGPRPGEAQMRGVYQRIDLAEFDDMAATNPYKILTFMAWDEMMRSHDLDDPHGYWALAGVHGMQWAYNGHKPSKTGFCKHAEPSFAAWHRPYVWTFEQGLQKAARRVVDRLEDPQLKAEYEAVLPTIRLCYWDFTHPKVPFILQEEEVQVIDNHGQSKTIDNPLHSFRYPRSPGGGRKSRTSRGARWVRGVARGSGPWKNELVAMLRSRDFKCTYNSNATCPGNLEQLHNSVHTTLGSDTGELSENEYAAFDPLFWMLHAMVDRCVWLFQNNNRDSTGWVEADTYFPFKPPGGVEHIGDMGYTYREPYTAAATAASTSSSSQRRRLMALHPLALPHQVDAPDAGAKVGSASAKAAVARALQHWSGGYNSYNWQLRLSNFTRYQVKGRPANVFVLLRGAPVPGATVTTADGASSSSMRHAAAHTQQQQQQQPRRIDAGELRTRREFCGSVEGFSDDGGDAHHISRLRVSAVVDLTDCLQRAGIATAVPPREPSRPERGPARAAVRLAQLQLYALAPDGTDLVPLGFSFGRPSVGWTLPVDIRAGTEPVPLLQRGQLSAGGRGGPDKPASLSASSSSSSSSRSSIRGSHAGADVVFAQAAGELTE